MTTGSRPASGAAARARTTPLALPMWPSPLILLILLSAALPARAGDDASRPASVPLQQFAAPPAGTYPLHVIQQGPQGRVRDSDGRAGELRRFTTCRVTLLSPMYTYCTDPIGCPLAFATMYGLRERLLATPELARRVRFVSLSFDPDHDTPETMRRYAGALADERSALRWHFLGTDSVAAIQAISDQLGQSVQVQRDQQGRPTRIYAHMLKLFLLDKQGRVREIYASAYLQQDVMYNDIRTLLFEQGEAR